MDIDALRTMTSDALADAAQLGRLDFVSAILAAVGLALVLGGIFSFFHFRSSAQETARQQAKETAREVAKSVANDYMQAQLPNILGEYRKFYGINEVAADSEADSIATAQDDGGKP